MGANTGMYNTCSHTMSPIVIPSKAESTSIEMLASGTSGWASGMVLVLAAVVLASRPKPSRHTSVLKGTSTRKNTEAIVHLTAFSTTCGQEQAHEHLSFNPTSLCAILIP
jgi:hypothetical protein